MQGDGGLAGAGAALDDQDAAGVGPDDAVLLGLDGADDVGHPAGARGVQRGQQHRLTRQAGALGDGGVVEVQGLVGDGHHRPAAGADVPPPPDAEVVQRGRGVEGLGRRRPPVDQQRLLGAVLGGQPDPAHVARHHGVVAVQSAEAEPAVGGVERHQALGVQLDGGLALAHGLRVVGPQGEHLLEPADDVTAHVVQPPVQSADVVLLDRQVRLVTARQFLSLFSDRSRATVIAWLPVCSSR